MATDHQIQPNRANAQKSTGPASPEGKRISPQNGVVHSLVSGTVVLKGESGFQQEMARPSESTPSAGSGAVLAATFRSLADNSRALDLQHRFEAAYHRQYNHALTLLLKLRETRDSCAPSSPPIQLATETWEDDFQGEPNFSSEPETDLTCSE